MKHLLNLLAAIALLVWGTHLVRTGVLRVFGANLRTMLARSMGNRFSAALSGMGLDSTFSGRSVNEGFSGGEKKRAEIVQLQLLNPKYAILDETDSGLDIDALRVVADGVNQYTGQGDRGLILITHYTRILRYIKPDFVHVYVDGRVVTEGGPELAEELEVTGYDSYVTAAADA